jgi:hypothetical protein
VNWNEDIFKAAFVGAGMWTPIQVLYAGTDVPFQIDADWYAPSVNPMTGVQSTDYEIEYEYADAPELDEGDQVIKDGALYRVRQEPRVDGIDPTGFFRRTLLTKVAPAC